MKDALKRSLFRSTLWVVLLVFVWLGYAWALSISLTVIFLYIEAKGLVHRVNFTTIHQEIAELRDELDQLRSDVETVDERLDAAIIQEPDEEAL